jgi:hypothetical protein
VRIAVAKDLQRVRRSNSETPYRLGNAQIQILAVQIPSVQAMSAHTKNPPSLTQRNSEQAKVSEMKSGLFYII